MTVDGSARLTTAPQDEHRPRGGQLWKRKYDGRQVRVQFRRSGLDPFSATRPDGSGISWSVVAYESPGVFDGVMHEEDFVKHYEFLRGRA